MLLDNPLIIKVGFLTYLEYNTIVWLGKHRLKTKLHPDAEEKIYVIISSKLKLTILEP